MDVNRVNEVWINYINEHEPGNYIDAFWWNLFHTDMVVLNIYIDKDDNPVLKYGHAPSEDISERGTIDGKKFWEGLLKEPHIEKFFKGDYDGGSVIIGEDFLMFRYSSIGEYNTIHMMLTSEEVGERIKNYIFPAISDNKSFKYVIISSQGRFKTKNMTIEKNLNTDISLNYNDDIPVDKYKEFCTGKESGIALLYGIPGTGKSTFIKHLISTCDSQFLMMDANLLSNICSADFIDFISEDCKNSVIVLEDCEKLLMSRDQTYNPILGTLLNLADGLLGDALHLKFICTFNTDLSNIDKAVLRKGRLKVKYEFRALSREKAQKLGESLGVNIDCQMTLADVYNTEQVDFSNKTKKIGF